MKIEQKMTRRDLLVLSGAVTQLFRPSLGGGWPIGFAQSR
jgi:hypothetical protein